jgi:hypothetical protein
MKSIPGWKTKPNPKLESAYLFYCDMRKYGLTNNAKGTGIGFTLRDVAWSFGCNYATLRQYKIQRDNKVIEGNEDKRIENRKQDYANGHRSA